MNRKIYIGIAVAVVLIALWMWWSKKSKKSKGVVSEDTMIEDPTPLSVGDVAPEETDVAWSAQEIEEEPTLAIKEE